MGQLSDLTIVIPIYEAATGKTLITGDYLTNTEGAIKLVSATVSFVTLGQGALASKGGVAFAKLFAAEVVPEAAGTTVIVCDKAGVPSAVTISLAMLLGTTAGMSRFE
ncbi:pre-toxin TG domain-containing protein [Anaerocolumna sp. AGMB13020]|uniref:pre-toxin TG domain-containing protein n=1 Tax=Anaerocolumna sp. AGMB13020 TaxID=3081750 RepID=UPI002954341B|nr:pre-toxin TG domain-containing protein [Anaerocolumna sp. AGMB13020]WOO37863.1 pre-toxin TG domain-containing protein [Anaerocolumna sp. AGMB13020]